MVTVNVYKTGESRWVVSIDDKPRNLYYSLTFISEDMTNEFLKEIYWEIKDAVIANQLEGKK